MPLAAMSVDSHTLFILIVAVVAVALVFDFLNGFHDAANAIATIVVTRTLTPAQAVIMAGIAEFIGYFIGGVAVAKMVGKGMVDITAIKAAGGMSVSEAQMIMIFAALLGAITWNILTWYWGLPSSSSHALIGGLMGSMLAAVGYHGLALSDKFVLFKDSFLQCTFSTPGGVQLPTNLIITTGFIFIAPILGMMCAAAVTVAIIWAFRRLRHQSANKVFRPMQLATSAWFCFGHGQNDAQKTMGVIVLALVAGGFLSPDVFMGKEALAAAGKHPVDIPKWVILSCYSMIALGTMFGGWRIIKTMGTKITKIRPLEGVCAESSAGLVLLGTAHFGVPVSTTHVISGAIMGVGAVENASKVRWNTARKILWAWILTIPLTAIYTAIVYWIIRSVYMALHSPTAA